MARPDVYSARRRLASDAEMWYNNVRQSAIVKAAGNDKSVTRRTFLNESTMGAFI